MTPSSIAFTKVQCALLLAIAGIVMLLSYVGWIVNDHPEVRVSCPDWVFDNKLIYDGYGAYISACLDLLDHPNGEGFELFQEFRHSFVHSDRIVYPALTALLIKILRPFFSLSIVWGAVIVSICFSFACLWMFNRITANHLFLPNKDRFILSVLFITHVSTISIWSRPMTDPVGNFFLFAIIYYAFMAANCGRWVDWILCWGCVIVGFFTKSVIILAIVLPIFVWIVSLKGSVYQKVLIITTVCIIGFVILGGILTYYFSSSNAHASFYIQAFKGALTPTLDMAWFKTSLMAGGLMTILALQVYPLFIIKDKFLVFRSRNMSYVLMMIWVAVYIFQRFSFQGFSLDFSRARYGAPLAPFVILLAWPGLKAWMEHFRWRRCVTWILVTGNCLLWLCFIITQ